MCSCVKDGVILAAGKGNRMKKNNLSLIKPLVPVNGKILIGYAIEVLDKAGIEVIHVIVSDYEDISIIKELYPHIDFKFYTHDNNNSAIVALRLVENALNGRRFVLADCDLVCDVNHVSEILDNSFSEMDEIDGFVACSEEPKFSNNRYLKKEGHQIVGFDKSGPSGNLHGGFMYGFNPCFYEHLNQHLAVNDMAYVLDSFFRTHHVHPMFLDNIGDIDEEIEIEEAEKILSMTLKSK